MRERRKDNAKETVRILESGYYTVGNKTVSIAIDLELKPVESPEFLYHGTASRFSEQIQREGLKPRGQQFVHLSSDTEPDCAVRAALEGGILSEDEWTEYRMLKFEAEFVESKAVYLRKKEKRFIDNQIKFRTGSNSQTS